MRKHRNWFVEVCRAGLAQARGTHLITLSLLAVALCAVAAWAVTGTEDISKPLAVRNIESRVQQYRAELAARNPLPDDLIPISTNQILRSGGLYSIANWPFYPPYPPGCWTHYADAVQFYYSPSRGPRFVFMDDRALVAARMALQAAGESSLMLLESEGDSGGGSYAPACCYTTNDLWLALLSASNTITGMAVELAVHSPAPDSYDLFLAPCLSSNHCWRWVMRTQPEETSLNVFNLTSPKGYFILGRTNDTDGDLLSDAAEQLITGTDPATADQTTIAFAITFPRQYVNTTTVTGAVTVTSGYPTTMAVLADDTNFDGAAWMPLAAAVPVNLGSNDGPKEVWVGLAGPTPDIAPAWRQTRLTLDQSAPSVVITSPTNTVVPWPMIQLQGYSPEPLSGVYFDVVNSTGQVTNQQGFVKAQQFDSALFKFTTNYFQCYDIALAEGTNTITLRTADRSGNMAVSDYVYVFSTNGDIIPPAIQLAWPQSGMKVCGDTFTVRGQLDDPTATLVASLSGTNGAQEGIPGLIGRYGQYWIENLPLAGGTNVLTLTATDAAGNSSTTNVTVVKSDVTFTMAEVPEEQLHQLLVTVTGTVSDDSYAVWVNGVEAAVDSSGDWTVSVPVSAAGTADFYASAYPAGEHPNSGLSGGGTNPSSPNALNLAVFEDKAPEVRVTTYHVDWERNVSSSTNGGIGPRSLPQAGNEKYHLEWTNRVGTTAYRITSSSTATCRWDYVWPADEYILNKTSPSKVGTMTTDCGEGSTNVPPPEILLEHCDVTDVRHTTNGSTITTSSYRRTAETCVQLFTGGKGLSRKLNLFAVQAPTSRITNPRWPVEGSQTTEPISPTNVVVGDLGGLPEGGTLYKALPDNETKDVTVAVEDEKFYTFDVVPQKYTAEIYLAGVGKITEQPIATLVGKRLSLACGLEPSGGPPITNYTWTVPNAIADFYVSPDLLQTNGHPIPLTNLTNSQVSCCWVDGGSMQTKCTLRVAGYELSAFTQFTVQKPTARLELSVLSGVNVWDNILAFGSPAFAGVSYWASEKNTLGDWRFIQTGHQLYRYQDAETGMWARSEGSGLDGDYPNASDRDKPSTTLPAGGSAVTADGSFTTYLAFRPTQNDVLVPIRQIHWNWQATAETNSAGAWVLITGTNHVDASDSPAPGTISWSDRVQRTLDLPPTLEQ